MIFTDTSSPLDLDMVVLQDCRGPETDGSGWFARVLRTPANRGETHGPEGECVVTGFVINTTCRYKCQVDRPYILHFAYELTHESRSFAAADECTERLSTVLPCVLNLDQQLPFGPRRLTPCVPLGENGHRLVI